LKPGGLLQGTATHRRENVQQMQGTSGRAIGGRCETWIGRGTGRVSGKVQNRDVDEREFVGPKSKGESVRPRKRNSVKRPKASRKRRHSSKNL